MWNVAGTPALCHCAGMGGADDKPVWERIAELGFADAVESKGFKRINATHWKMEGEGLTWRVRLVCGYRATPTSFLPVHGALVHGLDELYAKWDGSKASEFLHGAGQRVHMQSDTGADVTMAQKRDYEAGLIDPPKPKGWRGWLADFFEIERPRFDQAFLDIRYWGRAGNELRAEAFLTEGHDLDDVARVVTDYWERYSWPWIEARLDFGNLYRFHWGPGTIPDIRVPDPFYYAVAKLAGDQAHIETMANAVFTEARKTYEEVWRACERSGEISDESMSRKGVTRERFVKNAQMWGAFNARELEKIGRAFDLDLPFFDFDYGELDAYSSAASREF